MHISRFGELSGSLERRVPASRGYSNAILLVAVGGRLTFGCASAWVLSALMLLAVCHKGWAESSEATTVTKPLTMVTLHHSMQLMASMVLQGVEGPRVTCIAHSGADCCETVHFTPEDLKILSSAVAVIVNGAFNPEITQFARPDLVRIDVTSAVVVHEAIEAIHNPHFWMSPGLFSAGLEEVAKRIASLDPIHMDAFQTNTLVARQRLAELQEEMKTAFARIPDKRVVAYHDAFPYFAKTFGFEIVAVIQDGDEAPPPARLADTIRTMRATGTKVILAEEGGSGDRTAEMIARETGGVVCRLNTLQSGPVTPGAYADTMRSNMVSLLSAFGLSPVADPVPAK